MAFPNNERQTKEIHTIAKEILYSSSSSTLGGTWELRICLELQMLRHRDSYREEDERESREKGRELENQSTWESSREIWPQACMWACTEAQAGSWSLTCMVAASASRS